MNLSPLFSENMIKGYQLDLKNRTVPLLAGEVQFFRMDPAVWEKALSTAKSLGLPMVSSYLSWRRFEAIEGSFDFEGKTDPSLNLKRFLNLCTAQGLLLTLKPGPWICAEETNGGYPDWLIEREALQVLDAQNKPVLGYNPPFQSPIPSYSHPLYWEALEKWLKAVDDFIKPYLYPAGPIVLMQLDNEPCYTFHDRFLESDYNAAITKEGGSFEQWFNSFSTHRAVNNSGTGNDRSQQIQPFIPREHTEDTTSEDLLPWAHFKAWSLCEHVNRIGRLHRQNGIEGIPFSINVNLRPQLATPNNWQKLEEASGLGGFDYYPELPMQWSFFTHMVMAVTYSRLVNRIPWSPEMMSGIWSFKGQPNQPGIHAVYEYRYLQRTCMAYGLKGLNFYMLADRDNWIDSPINVEGDATEYAAPVKEVASLFNEIPGFLDYEIRSDLALLFDHDHAWEAFVYNENPELAKTKPKARAYQGFVSVFERLLQLRYTASIADLDVSSISVSDTPVLLAVLAESFPDELHKYLDAGGKLIVITDGDFDCALPEGNVNLYRCDLETLEDELPRVLEAVLGKPACFASNPALLSTLHQKEGSELVYLVNPTNEEQRTTVCLAPDKRFFDFFNPDLHLNQDGQSLLVPPRSVQVFLEDKV